MNFKLLNNVLLAGLITLTACQVSKQPTDQTPKEPRYKVAVCDWMILKRQKLGAFERAREIGSDGLELDLGGLGSRPTFDNKLLDPLQRQAFISKSDETGIEISSIAMSGFYAHNFAEREGIDVIMNDAINTMVMMNVKTAFLPLGVEGDLIKHPERRNALVTRLKLLGAKAEAAGVVIGIETAYGAVEEIHFLDEIKSPAIKSYFNFSNAIQNHRDICEELKIYGKDRIVMIHASGKDSVWLENDPHIDMPKIKKTLDEMGWSGWLVIERSRDASQPRNVLANYSANAAYLKKVFQGLD
ncbi:sugar phosphate isomerase/epimerase family protein [Geofilum sp. OHC36d9]|uniref:sugar phosphate isomerase/epimerase family protein n=1 Tax=Geofilum sp. OHC36d9 TaxID=3458413 RepID=UPI00403372F6